jgi:hypothetical protein
MTTAPGWYPDPTEANTMRFWNGTQWQGERTLMVSADTPENPAPAAQSPAPAGAAVLAMRTPMTPTSWLLFGGAALGAVGTLLPWEQDSTMIGTHITAGPASGGVALLLGLLAAVVWTGWPTRIGNLTKARRVGLTVLAACLTFFVFAKFAALGHAQSSADASSTTSMFGNQPTITYGPGLGLYLYSAGMVAVWIGTARAWRARRTESE